MQTQKGSIMKPVVLCIMDGVGINANREHNAVALAKMPFFNELLNKYPHSKLDASGGAVGLPDGIMGNSEDGHFTLGIGRIVDKFLRRFDHENWDENKPLIKFINDVKRDNGIVHLVGVNSDGCVHGSIEEQILISKHVLESGLRLCIHFVSDGRDTPAQSAEKYINMFRTNLAEYFRDGRVFFGTLTGRYYAMDRDHNLDRTEKAFNAIANGIAEYSAPDIDTALADAYARGETDEFIKPTVIKPTPITKQDGFLFGNYRSDRARQILRMILTTGCHIVCFSQYGEGLNEHCPALLPDIPVHNTLGDVLAEHGISQLRIAETEKYNHVTYFFDAERNIDFPNSKKILIPSQHVPTFDMKPECSAIEITDALLQELKNYSVVILNYANGDLLGHTGNEKAAIQGLEVLDKQLSRLVPAVLELDGTMLIIADHGNCEEMWDYEHNVPLTSHTTNPVNCIVVSNTEHTVHDGGLSDIAPTILKLLNIEKPAEMTGKSLI